jgi:type IV secretory pathway TraG/TraD family ATPase VirD4
VRPLLSPGDIRELPVDDQLMFVTGYKPMRVKKVRYYSDPTFTKRLLPAPDQSAYLNVPAKPRIEWLHERPKGEQFPFPQVVTGMPSEDRKPGDPDDDVDRDVPDDRLQAEGEYQ